MGKNSPSYKLFYTLVVLFLLFVSCFILYQHHRERAFRIELLQTQLQDFNHQVYDLLQDDSIVYPDKQQQVLLRRLIGQQNKEGLRLTLILFNGKVVFDSFDDNTSLFGNHRTRAEVQQALGIGEGFDIRRSSQTFGKDYFYSATYLPPNPLIVRSALPYNVEMTQLLKTNQQYLWFAAIITILLIFIFYYIISKMRSSISQKENLLTHLRISREGLAVFDAQRNLIMSNNLFNQYGNLISDVHLSNEEDILSIAEFSPVLSFLEQYSRRVFIENEPCTSTTIEKDGRIFLITCVIFYDHSFEVSINDVTQLEEQTRLKHQLTQNVAHELKTPVSSIQGYLETIIENEGTLDEEKMHHFLERCYAQSNRLANLLQDISTLNKMDDKGLNTEKESVDISLTVRNIFQDVAMKLEAQNMTINNELPKSLIVQGNPSLIYSIFRNLVDNAIAYAGTGTKITINKFRTDKDFHYFSFTDNGVGIEDQHLTRIFERFYRVDKGRSRKMGGTGLGLAIVKNAVIIHGGTISAKRGAEGGLEFIFTLKR